MAAAPKRPLEVDSYDADIKRSRVHPPPRLVQDMINLILEHVDPKTARLVNLGAYRRFRRPSPPACCCSVTAASGSMRIPSRLSSCSSVRNCETRVVENINYLGGAPAREAIYFTSYFGKRLCSRCYDIEDRLWNNHKQRNAHTVYKACVYCHQFIPIAEYGYEENQEDYAGQHDSNICCYDCYKKLDEAEVVTDD